MKERIDSQGEQVENRPDSGRAERVEKVDLIGGFTERFVNRWDWYAIQRADGSYVAFNRPLTPHHIERHLRAELTLGVYALDAEGRAKWMCLDADNEEAWAGVRDVGQSLSGQGVPAYLELSRPGRGHLWIFFQEPLAGRTVRAFARVLLAGKPRTEVFPKQDRAGKGPGSLMRLPLGIHLKSGERYPIAPVGEYISSPSVRSQLELLSRVQTVPTAFVAGVLADGALTASGSVPMASTELRPGLIAEIKSRLDIYDVVSKYVTLTPLGRGHCPFHDDEHMSFGVNRDGRYWNCFAGCGGGDVIEFWRRYRAVETSEAIRELAALFLS